MDGPDSSYSALVIHIVWKVDNEARIEPPIQTEYLRSGGAMILIFMVLGARAVISFCMRSAIPGNMVEVEAYYKLKETGDAIGQRCVYLATDQLSVIQEAKEK